MDYFEPRSVYGDYGRTHRNCVRFASVTMTVIVIIMIMMVKLEKSLSVETFSYSPFFPTSKTDRLVLARDVIH